LCSLTLKEFEILRYFMYRPHYAVTKDELIEKVWGFDSEAGYNNIEVYISFLRKKLAYIGSHASITTLRGIGYKLEE
jgi:DNA-binding response OmpR family regulator